MESRGYNIDIDCPSIGGAVNYANLNMPFVGYGVNRRLVCCPGVDSGTEGTGDEVSVGGALHERLVWAIEQVRAGKVEFEIMVDGGEGGEGRGAP